mmetsp:Transcript_25187/g.50635  ORF Transcript_25187/g.50635 Transcript_25187/m.50635 type:complete len:332 (-) Transcript_25187:762-1757(-)
MRAWYLSGRAGGGTRAHLRVSLLAQLGHGCLMLRLSPLLLCRVEQPLLSNLRLLLLEGDLRGELRLLHLELRLFCGPMLLRCQPEVRCPLLLRLRLLEEPQPSALLYRVIMHRLKLGPRLESAKYDFLHPVPYMVGTRCELYECAHVVELVRLVEKGLVGDGSTKGDHVAAGGIDEITDGIGCGVEHLLDVDELEEEHELDCEERVVIGADLVDVVVGRHWDHLELGEGEGPGLVGCLRAILGHSGPFKVMDPFVRRRNEACWSAHHAPLHPGREIGAFALRVLVDDKGLAGVDHGRRPYSDALVLHRVHKGGARPVADLYWAGSLAHLHV